ncbi:H-type lectin domain protein (macronuclear) [Tetrahymena thermophila SB210]|uniref:H-type lectin domain protein n=1 Tax=Tetrahymena thermophila (strain SB210) TaxID=312017 RepID=W7X5S3_TETTS|nr:H-type lectin domain protein [Tetrahymena thermophila SB210]EWS74710.1 H-type lectin domain protein [Tetrahymena thermophila SB210]|eukprot:XP_012652711.1 H-type lectin domain protein [Tetrahymena thermophila SB210]
MKFFKNQYLIIVFLFNLIYQTKQQYNIIQSDKVLIKLEQQIWKSTQLGSNQSRNYDFDISQGKFQNIPKIVYSLSVYGSDNSSNQGFLLTTNNLTKTKLNYNLKSLGCTIAQLGFNILAIDDPNIDVQYKVLSSSVATTITGTQDILQIAAFIYGFQGTDWSNLKLQYALTKIDSRNYKIQFTNSNIPTVYLNIVIIYQNSSTDIDQLYQSYMNFDTQAKICLSNQYLNPYTNNCDQSQPPSTSCSQITLNGSTFYYCQKCDPSCKECSAPGNLNSCTTCDINSTNKYFYNNQCQPSQPPQTYCDGNFICHQCDVNCSTCSGQSSNCQSCSDKVLIKPEQQIWQSTKLGSNQSRNYDFDISSGKFQNIPKIVYSLSVYNCDNNRCTIHQLGFNILAIDDPNIEVQQKVLSSSIATTITGTQDILQIAAFIYGFQGTNDSNLKLQYALTKIDSRNYKIQFTNSNIPTVYLNIVIIYQNSSTDIDQLYQSYMNFDTQGKNIGGDNTVSWETSAQIDNSPVFFGLKDFSISSYYSYFGIKIKSGQAPEAKNKQVVLNYFAWNGQPVNMINGIWMAFTLKTCQSGYTMFLNSTYNACVQSCNSVDHHYNTNPANTKLLYSTTITICQKCNDNCYGCKEGFPNFCIDCLSNMYLNPFTNTCDQQKPANTSCQAQTVNNQIFQNCQKCDPTCKECNSANNPKSCTSCDINSSNKYYYQNQCLSSQPSSTFCDSNFICQNCDPYCDTCSNSSNNCQSCKANSYQYQNNCLAKICLSNQYLNPFTNNCDQSQPPITSCSQITLNGSTFYYCQKCDPSCKECSVPGNSNSCTSCDINSTNKYFYNNQCQPSQPPQTYCDGNFICHQCDVNCSTCSGQSSNCQSCVTGKYYYQGKCLSSKPPLAYCMKY